MSKIVKCGTGLAVGLPEAIKRLANLKKGDDLMWNMDPDTGRLYLLRKADMKFKK